MSRYLAAGSPPRMRGKGSADVRTGQRTGITPAYAGKSPPAERSGPIRWDHPRVCGEKMDAATIQSGNAGSPPRMRGKDRRAVQGGIPAGITPAYAGKSPVVRERFLPAQDHPRVCGEKRSAGLGGRDGLGSPPRMRGKDRKDTDDAGIERITPAYAGKSIRTRTGTSAPRGSPPRMRGKVTATPANAGATGITPAYAGKRLKRSRSTVPPVAIVPLFPSVCNKPVVSDGSPAGRDAPLFLPAENAVPASPAYNLRSL